MNVICRKDKIYKNQTAPIHIRFTLDRQIRYASTGFSLAPDVDIRIVLQAALLANATSIIMAHNHPSGQLVAGYADIAMTKAIKEAATIVNIRVDDHIIVCKNGYYSFSENNQL